MLGVGAVHRAMEGRRLKRIFAREKSNVVSKSIKLLLKKATRMTRQIMSTFTFQIQAKFG